LLALPPLAALVASLPLRWRRSFSPVSLGGLPDLAAFRSIAVLLIAGTLAMHFYYFDAIVRFILASFDGSLALQPASQEPPALWFSVLRAGKYIVLGIAAVGILKCLRSPTRSQLVLAVVTIGLVVGTGISLLVFPSGAVRFLAFTMPVAAIFAAFVIVARVRQAGVSPLMKGSTLALCGLFVAAGVANSESTSLGYLLLDPPRSSGAWYGGSLPRTHLTALAGQWISRNDSPDAIYAVDLSTRMAPFFFGRVADRRVIVGPSNPPNYCPANSLVVDYELSAEGLMVPRLSVDATKFDRVYDNGSVAVYRRIREC
jgi:hypothetical protein